jgi:hypothetical protein
LWFWEPAATIGAPDSADCSVVREDRVGDRDFLY